MSIVNVDDHLSVSVDLLYERGRSSVEYADQWRDIATRRDMAKTVVDLQHLNSGTGFVPFEDGQRVEQHIRSSLARMRSAPFERTISIHDDDLRDMDAMRGLEVEAVRNGEEAGKHPNHLVFGALKAAASSLYTYTAKAKSTEFPLVAYDGQPLLSVAAGDRSFANLDAAGGGERWYLIAGSSIVKPLIFGVMRDYELDEDMTSMQQSRRRRWLADARVGVGAGEPRHIYASNQTLNQTNFNAAYEAMMAFPDDNGQSAGVMPTHLLVPPSLRAQALAIVGTVYLDDSPLVANYNRGVVKSIISPWLVA